MIRLLPWLLASYLLGAIPTSYLVVRLAKGQNMRDAVLILLDLFARRLHR